MLRDSMADAKAFALLRNSFDTHRKSWKLRMRKKIAKFVQVVVAPMSVFARIVELPHALWSDGWADWLRTTPWHPIR